MRNLLIGLTLGVVLGGLGTGLAQNRDFYGRPQWGNQVTPPQDGYGRPNFPQQQEQNSGSRYNGRNPC